MGNETEYFAEDYAGARAKFLAACRSRDITVETQTCPGTGPDGEELYTDIAVTGAAAPESVLLVCSATHGTEGSAGSGIQVGLLCETLPEMVRSAQRVIMIHAMNPFGFAHRRRANEDNIDLNRNFIDHDKPSPENADYARLAEHLAPRNLGLLTSFRHSAALDLFKIRYGEGRLQAAITGGQYSHPEGHFYGGDRLAWSVETFRDTVERHVRGAKRVGFIDLHTGLGRYGEGEFIMDEPVGSEAYSRAVRWLGPHVASTVSGDSVSSALSGTLDAGLKRMLPETDYTGGGLEFGTFPMSDVMGVLRKENWLWHHGGPDHPRAKSIRDSVKGTFFPNTPLWNDMVWRQGKAVVEQTMAGLAGELD